MMASLRICKKKVVRWRLKKQLFPVTRVINALIVQFWVVFEQFQKCIGKKDTEKRDLFVYFQDIISFKFRTLARRAKTSQFRSLDPQMHFGQCREYHCGMASSVPNFYEKLSTLIELNRLVGLQRIRCSPLLNRGHQFGGIDSVQCTNRI